jgi:hypothetical protein
MRNALKSLKCGVGERLGGSFRPIVCEMKKCYIESRRRGKFYVKYKDEGKIDCRILLINCLLNHVIEENIEGRI